MGPHRGTPARRTKFLCVNHGEQNPDTGVPDSCCGKLFSKSQEVLACAFHTGYYAKDGKWTCCGDDNLKNNVCAVNDKAEHK